MNHNDAIKLLAKPFCSCLVNGPNNCSLNGENWSNRRLHNPLVWWRLKLNFCFIFPQEILPEELFPFSSCQVFKHDYHEELSNALFALLQTSKRKSAVDDNWSCNIKLEPAEWIICEELMSANEQRGILPLLEKMLCKMCVCVAPPVETFLIVSVSMGACVPVRLACLTGRATDWAAHTFQRGTFDVAELYLAASSGGDFSRVTISKKEATTMPLHFQSFLCGSWSCSANQGFSKQQPLWNATVSF